jgi:pantothenate kinase
VITEGNYLLHDAGGWENVGPQLDESWYLDVPASDRENRLIGRRRSFGESTADATVWVHGVDQVNGTVVEASRHNADFVIRLTTQLQPTR